MIASVPSCCNLVKAPQSSHSGEDLTAIPRGNITLEAEEGTWEAGASCSWLLGDYSSHTCRWTGLRSRNDRASAFS